MSSLKIKGVVLLLLGLTLSHLSTTVLGQAKRAVNLDADMDYEEIDIRGAADKAKVLNSLKPAKVETHTVEYR